MDLAKIIIAGKTRNYTELNAAEIAIARKLSGGGGGGVTIVPFATGTDEQIVAMIQAAHAGTIDLQADGGWAVGDTRTISISAFAGGGSASHPAQDIEIVISSFADYMNCGCVLQFDFNTPVASGQRMGPDDNKGNIGGYGASEMKTTTLPALVNALPAWLKDSLIEFSCLSSAGSKSSTITTISGNKLALRSEVEITNTTSYSFSGEGSQIPYYITTTNRAKKISQTPVAYWTRSPSKSSQWQYAYISGGGTAQANAQWLDGDYYLAPFGCL